MLHFAIAAGLILGIVVGLAASATGNEWLLAVAKGSAPLGAIFMNAIKMVVIPLIVTVIFTSIAKLGDPRKLGRIGGFTITYYWITLIPAILIGMGAMYFGLQFASDIELPRPDSATVPELQSIVDFLISLVPSNPFAAASSGQILPLTHSATAPNWSGEIWLAVRYIASRQLQKLSVLCPRGPVRPAITR